MGQLDSGNAAWILTSASLVFLMTPGVAFFYGGMVRAKAVLNMMIMEAAALSVTMIMWVLWGWSIAYAGTSVGGRTGLTAVVVGLLFLASLFLAPLAGTVPAFATAPALCFVAVLMIRGLAEIDWEDLTESTPAVVTAITMPFTFSISHGIAFGFISYVGIKALAGRARELSPMVVIIAAVFVCKFAFL